MLTVLLTKTDRKRYGVDDSFTDEVEYRIAEYGEYYLKGGATCLWPETVPSACEYLILTKKPTPYEKLMASGWECPVKEASAIKKDDVTGAVSVDIRGTWISVVLNPKFEPPKELLPYGHKIEMK